MAELTFFFGTMNSGKSTLALQIDHTCRGAGLRGLRFTMHDRDIGSITSRIGLVQPALLVAPGMDFRAEIEAHLARGDELDYIVCDEAQFYAVEQIDGLAGIVDDLHIDVYAFGLLTDFTTHLFPGSRRLLEIADRRRELQVDPRCWCGRRATLNARTVGGEMVVEGEQVVIGDLHQGYVAYEVLCREHHRRQMPRATAG